MARSKGVEMVSINGNALKAAIKKAGTNAIALSQALDRGDNYISNCIFRGKINAGTLDEVCVLIGTSKGQFLLAKQGAEDVQEEAQAQTERKTEQEIKAALKPHEDIVETRTGKLLNKPQAYVYMGEPNKKTRNELKLEAEAAELKAELDVYKKRWTLLRRHAAQMFAEGESITVAELIAEIAQIESGVA